MGAQRITFFVVLAAVLAGGFFFLRTSNDSKTALRVCTWSNYFPDNIIRDFSKSTGIPVELSYVSSNEELFSKLKAGATGFDIILPSDYMVVQMIQLKMLRSLDARGLPNLGNLDDWFRHLPYDEGNHYSIPFTWGTTGIAVNTAKVNVPSGEVGWEELFNSPDPHHTSLLDDMREVFGAVLAFRGLEAQIEQPTVLKAAKSDISQAKNHILMFTSEPKPLLLNGELTVAHIYSCDAAQAQAVNPAIRYYIPKQGATLWADNFAIPSSSQHVAEAEAFINYFLDPDHAYTIVRQNHLSTPNRVTKERLAKDAPLDPNFYPPPEVMNRLHFMGAMPQILPEMNRMWTELKS